MRFKIPKFLATLCLSALFAGSAFSATVIYSDDFTTGTSGALNGQAPQVRPGTETWTAASQVSKDITTGRVLSSTAYRTGYLPTVLVWDSSEIHTITARLFNTAAASSTDWTAVGWGVNNSTDGYNATSSGSTYWLLWRGNGQLVAWTGIAASGSQTVAESQQGVNDELDVRLSLNMTTKLATFEYKDPNATDWTLSTTTLALNETRIGDIKNVGMSMRPNAGVASFEYAVIPEPRAALLGGLGLLALLRRRR